MKKGKGRRSVKGMASHEILRKVMQVPQVKNVAVTLKRSAVGVYKWTEPSGPDQSGKKNPADHFMELLEALGPAGDELVQWVCLQRNGFFVANPPPRSPQESLTKAALVVMGEADEWQRLLRRAALRGQLSAAEVKALRLAWERLKSSGEGFLTRHEAGVLPSGALFQAGHGRRQSIFRVKKF